MCIHTFVFITHTRTYTYISMCAQMMKLQQQFQQGNIPQPQFEHNMKMLQTQGQQLQMMFMSGQMPQAQAAQPVGKFLVWSNSCASCSCLVT